MGTKWVEGNTLWGEVGKQNNVYVTENNFCKQLKNCPCCKWLHKLCGCKQTARQKLNICLFSHNFSAILSCYLKSYLLVFRSKQCEVLPWFRPFLRKNDLGVSSPPPPVFPRIWWASAISIPVFRRGTEQLCYQYRYRRNVLWIWPLLFYGLYINITMDL